MKRGASGLSLLVGVNKPAGITSHDVVNRCRRIFGERRVGHAGTLDPSATGVMLVCIGPATRLDSYLTSEYKDYRGVIAFGCETATDDAEGEVTITGDVRQELFDAEFAAEKTQALIGFHDQVPPQYSAIKVNGQKAYARARAGHQTELAARRIEVAQAQLVSVTEGECGSVSWTVDFRVSKGTYIRALARDLGRMLGCPAHLAGLCRTKSGSVSLEECVSIDSLESLKEQAALDPVRALGLRFAYLDPYAARLEAGASIGECDVALYDPLPESGPYGFCSCSTDLVKSYAHPHDGELACFILANRLKAIYRFSAGKGLWQPDCVFATSVYRG